MKYDADTMASNMKIKRKINKILLIIVTILLSFMVLFSLFLISLELGNSKELPGFLNISIYIVTSESMEPRLKTDDIIIVKKGYANNEFKVGNIITYNRPDGEVITHRIKRIIKSDLENAYVTQGDNNNIEDEVIVNYDMIIGKVIYTMPRFGKVVKLLKNKVFFTFSLLVLLFFIWYDRRVMNRQKERKLIRKKYENKSDFYF